MYSATSGVMSPLTKCSTDIISRPHGWLKSMSFPTSGAAKTAAGERRSARTVAVPERPRLTREWETTTGSTSTYTTRGSGTAALATS